MTNGETDGAPLETLNVGQQVWREQHRLRALEVCVPRHDGVDVRFRQVTQMTLELRESRGQHGAVVLREHPQVSSDLVIAGARSVQPRAGIADLLPQRYLDIQVD